MGHLVAELEQFKLPLVLPNGNLPPKNLKRLISTYVHPLSHTACWTVYCITPSIFIFAPCYALSYDQTNHYPGPPSGNIFQNSQQTTPSHKRSEWLLPPSVFPPFPYFKPQDSFLLLPSSHLIFILPFSSVLL